MYYLELPNFPTDLLTEQYRCPESTLDVKNWNVKIDFFKQEIIDFFVKHNLELKDGEIFKKNPRVEGAAHTDVVWDTVQSTWTPWHCALNINLDNTDSLMYWFSTSSIPVPPEQYPQFQDPTLNPGKLNGIHYASRHNNKWKDDKRFSVIESLNLNKPTLVKTNLPHAVRNLDNKTRWCLSLRFRNNPTFEECAEKLLTK